MGERVVNTKVKVLPIDFRQIAPGGKGESFYLFL